MRRVLFFNIRAVHTLVFFFIIRYNFKTDKTPRDMKNSRGGNEALNDADISADNAGTVDHKSVLCV